MVRGIFEIFYRARIVVALIRAISVEERGLAVGRRHIRRGCSCSSLVPPPLLCAGAATAAEMLAPVPTPSAKSNTQHQERAAAPPFRFHLILVSACQRGFNWAPHHMTLATAAASGNSRNTVSDLSE